MWKKAIDTFMAKCVEMNDLYKCLTDENYIDNKFKEINEKVDEAEMLKIEQEELVRRVRAFSKEDWEIVINEAPIELCHNRIGRELKEAKEFKRNIGAAMYEHEY
jgi:hypothetical protein